MQEKRRAQRPPPAALGALAFRASNGVPPELHQVEVGDTLTA
jgi:hypothetical protein